MSVSYEVKVNGKSVWHKKTKEYDRDAIPAEYRDRPESGTVKLYVNGELIGTQVPLNDKGDN